MLSWTALKPRALRRSTLAWVQGTFGYAGATQETHAVLQIGSAGGGLGQAENRRTTSRAARDDCQNLAFHDSVLLGGWNFILDLPGIIKGMGGGVQRTSSGRKTGRLR